MSSIVAIGAREIEALRATKEKVSTVRRLIQKDGPLTKKQVGLPRAPLTALFFVLFFSFRPLRLFGFFFFGSYGISFPFPTLPVWPVCMVLSLPCQRVLTIFQSRTAEVHRTTEVILS